MNDVAVAQPSFARPSRVAGHTFWRALGLLLFLLASLPVYRVLATAETGSAGAATVGMADGYAAMTWSGTLLVLLVGLLAARFLPAPRVSAAVSRLASLLQRPALSRFAAGCGLAATGLALVVTEMVLRREPLLIDALSQLVHARYLAAGQLAGPNSPFAPFWHLQQTVLTPAGWVAQYPPGHTLLLALGLRLGAASLVGPVLLGATVFLTALLAHRVLPADPLAARLGTLLLALSPFAAGHAAGYTSHTSAAFLAVAVLYAASRTGQPGERFWALPMGVALGALFATRPLTAVVVGMLAAGWLLADRPRRFTANTILLAAAGAVPLLVLLGWYHDHFFGNPLRFGYLAALGEDAGLGFGIDPWGNRYGVQEAIGYTSAELGALNLFLLESPLPVVSLCGLGLLLLPRLQPGTRLLGAWAMLPLGAHLFYWHHGLFMGPRMLNEYAPAWCLLIAALALAVLRSVPERLPRAPRWSPVVFAGAVMLFAWGAALFWLAPARLLGYRAAVEHREVPADLAPDNSLVFVHGSWATRLAMQLAGTGMRLDSLETLMRQNSTCRVQRWLDAGRRDVPVSFARVAPDPAALRTVELAGGSRVRLDPDEPWAPACARQAAADRGGVMEVAGLLWRGALPGTDSPGPLFVRDLGPEANARLIAALGRQPYLLASAGDALGLIDYDAAMDSIWALHSSAPRAVAVLAIAREGDARP